MPIEPPDFSAYYRTQATIGDLMRQQSQAQADAALRSGAIWSNAITDISRMAMALPQTIERTKAYAEEKRSLAQRHAVQDEKDRQEMAAKQRDAMETEGLNQLFSDPSKPPTQAQVFGLVGPERGIKILSGLQTLQNVQGKPPDFKSEDERLSGIANMYESLDSLPETARAQAYGPVTQILSRSGYLKPEDNVPETYDPAWWGSTGAALRGYKKKVAPPPKPGTHVVGGYLVNDAGNVLFRDPKAGEGRKIWVKRGGDFAYVDPSEVRPGDTPAGTREQGRPVTSGDANKLAEMNTSLDQLNALRGDVKGTGAASWALAQVPDVVTSITGIGATAKSKQAGIDRVKQIIGKALEGGVLRKEDEIKYEKILPKIGDSDEVVDAKMNGLWQTIQSKRQELIDSLSDSGYDVSKLNARGPREQLNSGGLTKEEQALVDRITGKQ